MITCFFPIRVCENTFYILISFHPCGQYPNRWHTLMRTVGFEPTKNRAWKALNAKLFGIRFGTSSRTAVKYTKHSLEVILQAYFTIKNPLFHGKKAANSYLSPQFNCFFSFSMIKSLNESGDTTSTVGPKESILITISGSSL